MRGCSCRGTAGFAHVSCLAEQAKILMEEAEENNLGMQVFNQRWDRWHTCSLCEQHYHGVVKCALGWACWKTYLGRPERDQVRGMAMNLLGLGLEAAKHHEGALSVREVELSMLQRRGADVDSILIAQGNLAITYQMLGRFEEAHLIQRNVYFGFLKLHGGQHQQTLTEADNYAASLVNLQRFEEAKSLIRKTLPVAQRVLGESDELTLRMRWNHAKALFATPGATLQDIRETVAILEDIEPIARRVLGGGHPTTVGIETNLGKAREARRRAAHLLLEQRLRGDAAEADVVREAPEPGDVTSVREAMETMAPGNA